MITIIYWLLSYTGYCHILATIGYYHILATIIYWLLARDQRYYDILYLNELKKNPNHAKRVLK